MFFLTGGTISIFLCSENINIPPTDDSFFEYALSYPYVNSATSSKQEAGLRAQQ